MIELEQYEDVYFSGFYHLRIETTITQNDVMYKATHFVVEHHI